MRTGYKGKYTRLNKNDPRAIARCDYSGFMVKHSTLVKQMEYRGRGLVWTGFWVDPKFADVPNPQNLVPIIGLDPIPIPNSRPDTQIDSTAIPTINIFLIQGKPILLSLEQLGFLQINFVGDLTSQATVTFPNVIGSWTVFNYTSGGQNILFNSTHSSNSYIVAPNESINLYASFNMFSNIQPAPTF
jgi:hypothetical protein